ncbi:MAG: type II toxin-antitoxin system death-on-curing family toxin [Clostridia bacterium]|nr:type II toxin-antitoxin system death-on-curing family toxin [Clostridia bacterium]
MYLDQTQIIVIHQIVMAQDCADIGVDPPSYVAFLSVDGFLSAVHEPRQTFEGKELYPDLMTKAAALMRSLIGNHPFIDGNKRTAVIAVLVFLAHNGYALRDYEHASDLSPVDKKLMNLALDIAAGHVRSISRVARCLKKHTRLVPRQEIRTAENRVISRMMRFFDQVSRWK